ncbi:MAG: hypothetical protein J2P37_14895, partial [Ktedonobacteraceae bacterium]|nr:hypothetical protein [Ktedonobacteraceae bacterium]
SGAVASISGATMAADTTTLINWGDGSPATVGMVSGSSSMLTVSGSHTYTQGGTFTLTVSATEDTRSAQSTGQAVVQPPLALTAQNISALAGVVFNGQVATGTFAGLSGPFSAIINWGDGNTTLGTVTVTGSGTFAVTGTHTYANSGNFLLTVTVVDTNGHSATSTSMATVTAPLTITVLTITSVEGAPFSGQVASGTFTGITGPFTATISWGDGTPSSSGTVLVSGNTFTVNGSHTYTEEGSYPLTVTVSDTSGHQITGSGTATVSDAPLTLNSMSVSALLRTATLSATFTDANPFADASDFQATIAWGDNTTTQGTVRKNVFGNSFSVSGSHTYSRTGTFTVTLTIAERDDGQPSVQGTRTVTIFL